MNWSECIPWISTPWLHPVSTSLQLPLLFPLNPTSLTSQWSDAESVEVNWKESAVIGDIKCKVTMCSFSHSFIILSIFRMAFNSKIALSRIIVFLGLDREMKINEPWLEIWPLSAIVQWNCKDVVNVFSLFCHVCYIIGLETFLWWMWIWFPNLDADK